MPRLLCFIYLRKSSRSFVRSQSENLVNRHSLACSSSPFYRKGSSSRARSFLIPRLPLFKLSLSRADFLRKYTLFCLNLRFSMDCTTHLRGILRVFRSSTVAIAFPLYRGLWQIYLDSSGCCTYGRTAAIVL